MRKQRESHPLLFPNILDKKTKENHRAGALSFGRAKMADLISSDVNSRSNHDLDCLEMIRPSHFNHAET